MTINHPSSPPPTTELTWLMLRVNCSHIWLVLIPDLVRKERKFIRRRDLTFAWVATVFKTCYSILDALLIIIQNQSAQTDWRIIVTFDQHGLAFVVSSHLLKSRLLSKANEYAIQGMKVGREQRFLIEGDA